MSCGATNMQRVLLKTFMAVLRSKSLLNIGNVDLLSQGIVRISCKMSCSVTPQNNDIYELIIHDISIFSIFFKVKVI